MTPCTVDGDGRSRRLQITRQRTSAQRREFCLSLLFTQFLFVPFFFLNPRGALLSRSGAHCLCLFSSWILSLLCLSRLCFVPSSALLIPIASSSSPLTATTTKCVLRCVTSCTNVSHSLSHSHSPLTSHLPVSTCSLCERKENKIINNNKKSEEDGSPARAAQVGKESQTTTQRIGLSSDSVSLATRRTLLFLSAFAKVSGLRPVSHLLRSSSNCFDLHSSDSGALTVRFVRYPSIERPQYKRFRFSRRYRTGSLSRQSGSTHVHELTRERRLLALGTRGRRACNKASTASTGSSSSSSSLPMTQGAHLLYVSGVDSRLSEADLEGFFCHFLCGGVRGKVTARLARDTNQPVGNHRGHGILFFETPFLATTCLLKYNGVMLGDRNVVLSEAYRRDYLLRKRGVGPILRAANELVARGRDRRASCLEGRGAMMSQTDLTNAGGGEFYGEAEDIEDEQRKRYVWELTRRSSEGIDDK